MTNLRSHRAHRLIPPLIALLFVAAGCEDDSPPGDATTNPARSDGAADASDGGADAAAADAVSVDAVTVDRTDGGADASPEASAGETGAAPAPIQPMGLAILTSDHKSTSLSLMALGGTTISRDHCFHSGSMAPQLSAALSGDVVLPSSLQPRNEIVLVDRKSGTLTWLAPGTCAFLRQMNVGSGFPANPYDLVAGLPGGKGYVTRFGTDPGNPAIGSDLLIIDTDKAVATGRIDLRAFAPAVTPPAQPLLPAPTHAVAVAGKVYVLLNNLSADYNNAGVGRLVAIDPATDEPVGMIDLPGLTNCGALQAIADASTSVLVVGCSGPFSAGAAQIESAGIAWIDVSKTPAAITIVKSAPFARPVSGFDVAAVDPALGFTVVNGEFGMPPGDAVWAFDFAGGMPRKLFEASTSFSLSIALEPGRARLFILDAATANPRVRAWNLPRGGAPVEAVAFAANPAAGLPPRQLAAY